MHQMLQLYQKHEPVASVDGPDLELYERTGDDDAKADLVDHSYRIGEVYTSKLP